MVDDEFDERIGWARLDGQHAVSILEALSVKERVVVELGGAEADLTFDVVGPAGLHLDYDALAFFSCAQIQMLVPFYDITLTFQICCDLALESLVIPIGRLKLRIVLR